MNLGPESLFPYFTDHSQRVFVGRKNELARLDEELGQGSRRIACITGIPGIGKTALANEFGHRFIRKYYGYVTSLSAYGEPMLLDAMAYRIRGLSPTLIIVNDAECLSPAQLAELVHRVRSNSPEDRLIITSRESISVPGLDLSMHLDLLPEVDSEKLLMVLLGEPLYWTDLKSHRVYDLLKGHPLALNLVAGAIGSGVIRPDEIRTYLQPFLEPGVRSKEGEPLEEQSEPYRDIVATVTTVSDEFLRKLADNPALLYELSPRSFEELVAELLDRQGYRVELTPASRDGGKDIFVATNDSLGSFLYLVECKRFAPDRPVGVALIRQLYGTVQAERATAGILATTSFFTKGAQEFQTGVRFQVGLQDYFGIQKWLREAIGKV